MFYLNFNFEYCARFSIHRLFASASDRRPKPSQPSTERHELLRRIGARSSTARRLFRFGGAPFAAADALEANASPHSRGNKGFTADINALRDAKIFNSIGGVA